MSETNINEIIVAAIDFGTTFSGYAYSYREEYLRDPLQIYSNRWDGQILPQAPTVLLFNSEKTESYFGFEAEEKYDGLIKRKEHKDWRYFRRFKMDLHREKKLTRKMTIKDAQGRKMPAVEAGIKEDQLSLAYEPEAAAIYCKHIRLAKLKEPGKDATIQPFPTGLNLYINLRFDVSFFLLVLLGGTVDISAHEVQEDGTLKALIEPIGGKWGGTLVDDGFLEIFEGLFGADIMNGLKHDIEQAESKRELDAEIEMKKRTIVGKSNAKANNTISIKLPFALREGTKSAQFESALESGTYELIQDRVGRLDAVVMAGGFSDSKVVQEAIKDVLKNYPKVDLIIPENSASAIVHGAVLYGFNPSVISTRKSKYSYGISTSAPFFEEHHPLSHIVQRDGSNKCEDIFKVFVKKGEEVILDKQRLLIPSNPLR
ncbi:HS12B-like protein [Mya arenaria]|uniref:HS12B-like protein n=1 Tax=Mya arenaria TaxID=6604 RepID=A0ABY7EW41_MYAAR|nr:HS12B-like protein [Mya arenaria]